MQICQTEKNKNYTKHEMVCKNSI